MVRRAGPATGGTGRPREGASGRAKAADRTVSAEELRSMIRRGEDFVLVETGSPRAYRRGHLPAAKHLPPGRVREIAPDLLPDRDADIVVYSPGERAGVSARTADILRRMGYSDVRVCAGARMCPRPGERAARA